MNLIFKPNKFNKSKVFKPLNHCDYSKVGLLGQGFERTSQDGTYLPNILNLNVLNRNSNYWGILVQGWPKLGQWHTCKTPRMMKDDKKTIEKKECQQGMVKLQQTIIRVLKRHAKNTLKGTMLDKKIFFLGKGGTNGHWRH